MEHWKDSGGAGKGDDVSDGGTRKISAGFGREENFPPVFVVVANHPLVVPVSTRRAVLGDPQCQTIRGSPEEFWMKHGCRT